MGIVGFVGPFGDSNFGDYAMLVNDIYDINKKNIMIFSYNTDFIADISNFYLNDCNLEIVQVDTFKIPLIATGKSFKIEYDDYSYVPFEILSKISNYNVLVDRVSQIEVLVVSGGGFLNRLWNAKHRQHKLFSIMAVILIAEQLKKRIVFLGNTFGPFDDSFEMFRCFFGRLQNVVYATRDNLCSPMNMRSIGVSQEITVLPDDFYFINGRLKKEALKNNTNGSYIVLELYESIDFLDKNIEMIKEFVSAIKDKYNLNVLFLPLDREYGGQYQGEYILKSNCEIMLYDLNLGFLPVEEACNVIKNAELIICQRYHLFVLSIANNIPVIQIFKDVCGDKRYYYNKSVGMLCNILFEQEWSESLFFSLSIESAFKNIMHNYYDIISAQKNLFNSKKKESEKRLLNKRLEYINRNIL